MPVNLIKDRVTDKKVTALKDAVVEDYKKTAEYWFWLGYYFAEAGKYKEAWHCQLFCVNLIKGQIGPHLSYRICSPVQLHL